MPAAVEYTRRLAQCGVSTIVLDRAFAGSRSASWPQGEVTSGTLYQLFGGKLGLYAFVRKDFQQATAGPSGRRPRGLRASVGSQPTGLLLVPSGGAG